MAFLSTRALGLLLAFLLTADAHAQSAALRGKSIILSWQDQRTIKNLGSGEVRMIGQTSNIKLYVSVQGRIFNEMVRAAGQNVRQDQQVSGQGRNQLTWQFQGRSLVADQHFLRGARRVIINFDDGFTKCSVRVLHGKEAGSQPIQYKDMTRGAHWEIQTIGVTSSNCSVRDGNVFGG
jgi:hypothetical protein